MKTTVRYTRTAVAVLVALSLAGCGGAGAAGDASGSPAGASSGTAQPAGPVSVETDYGTVEVPQDPQTVVVLNYALAGYLYDLDIPVTATIPEDTEAEGEHSEFWAEEAEDDGTVYLPWSADGFDLEAILALEPDLIIGGGIGFPLFQAEEAYEDLSAIAPTLLVGRELTSWQDQFSFLAGAFGKGDLYEEHVQAYEERETEVREAITPPEGEVAFLSLTADGTPYGLVEDVGLPTTFADLGFEVAPVFADGGFEVYGPGGDMFELSTEKVGQVMTQETLFIAGFNAETTSVEDLRENPVYAALPAFQDNQAQELPYWSIRGDYDEALALLDQIEELYG